MVGFLRIYNPIYTETLKNPNILTEVVIVLGGGLYGPSSLFIRFLLIIIRYSLCHTNCRSDYRQYYIRHLETRCVNIFFWV